MTPRRILVAGADRAFGADVVARLRADGILVLEALPEGVTLDALIFDLTVPTGDLPFDAVTDDDFRELLGANLYTLVETVQAAVPHLTQDSAIVVIVPNAYLGSWGGVHVAASAAACVAMARSMALELAPLGIRVNTVAIGEATTPADAAATAVWLAGPGSGAVTGEAILSDRGASLKMAQATRRSPANTRM